MTSSRNALNALVSKQNISYYDKIASEYDLLLSGEKDNTAIRQIVASKFADIVKGGFVLDFGGGTGLDLNWLNQENCRIIFCEPSKEMRQIAINRKISELPDANIKFLDDREADFRNWIAELPFDEKVDAILANFAVINCIPDIKRLFEKLALVIKPGGTFLALILENSFLKRVRSNLKGTLYSIISGQPTGYHVDFKENRQLVYIHSTKSIRKMSEQNFELLKSERLTKFGFSLIHLVRK